MAEGSEAPYQPNVFVKPDPLPDKMMGSYIYGVGPMGKPVVVGRTVLHPNEPAPPSDPVEDRRPDRLLEAAGFSSAEEWGNSILRKRNGRAR